MKFINLNYIYFLCIGILFPIKQIYGQDIARDSLLIYHEVIVTIGEYGSFDPYYAFTKDPDKKNHPIYKRFFALYHETLIEKARNQLNPNFVHNRENVFVTTSDLIDPIRAKIVFVLPDDFEEPWRFHNGNMITADDLITSIRYAICKGILSDKIFKNDLIVKENDYKFSISFNLEFNLDIILRYLEKVYVIPHDYYWEYVVNEKCSEEDYSILERPYDIAAGPYQCKDCESPDKVVLIRNNRYPKRPFTSGIGIKKHSIKSDHYNLLVVEGESNIAMDLPAGTITAAPEDIYVNRIEGWKVKALFFDYSNPIFQQVAFRKIISKIIDVSKYIRQKLDNQANLVTGPYTTLHIGNNPDVAQYLTKEETARFRGNKTNYIESIKDKIEAIDKFNYDTRNRNELYYKNDRVKIVFCYNRERMTKQEKDALDPIIQNLKEIGIEIYPSEQNNQTIKHIKTNPNKWDILYDEIEIQLKESASEYFMSFDGENINYHKYSNPALDKLFLREQTTLDPGISNNIKREIHKILHDDYAAIFLWSMYNYYTFDTAYISTLNNHLINSVNFFTTPERWKMIRDEN